MRLRAPYLHSSTMATVMRTSDSTKGSSPQVSSLTQAGTTPTSSRNWLRATAPPTLNTTAAKKATGQHRHPGRGGGPPAAPSAGQPQRTAAEHAHDLGHRIDRHGAEQQSERGQERTRRRPQGPQVVLYRRAAAARPSGKTQDLIRRHEVRRRLF